MSKIRKYNRERAEGKENSERRKEKQSHGVEARKDSGKKEKKMKREGGSKCQAV